MHVLVNIDVPDLERGVVFYTTAFGLRVGRRFGPDFIELLGAESRIYLLAKPEHSAIGPASGDTRRYCRHWSPIHLDIVVDDIQAAISRAVDAGATRESETLDQPYGQLALFADPFGHGFCLIEFNKLGYDAVAEP